MTDLRLKFRALLVSLFVLQLSAGAESQSLTIEVGRAAVRKYRLAIPHFGIQKSSGAFQESSYREIPASFSRLFDFTGEFEVANPASLSDEMLTNNSKKMDFDYWSSMLVEYVILGSGQVEKIEDKDHSSLDLRLFDIRNKKVLLGKRYSRLTSKDVDKVVRRFADLCVHSITGLS